MKRLLLVIALIVACLHLWAGDNQTAPWATNISRPNSVTEGLAGNHIALWASHGMYYDHKKGYWRYQRPNLYGTHEDLFTQTIVVPYLIPMLESAGAYVFTPRERDWQVNEFVNEPIAIAGRYAVYIRYDEGKGPTTYSVVHGGVRTDYSVNRAIGWGTWVYLGTFDFGTDPTQNAVLENGISLPNTYATTTSVRFGGGMGSIERGGQLSGVPRCLEGARYYAEYAGAPEEVYANKGGNGDDYSEDINVRSLMVNWLMDRGVPFDLCLAVHSDAGYYPDQSVYGSLAIATTELGNPLRTGQPRTASLDFAKQLFYNLESDMRNEFGTWHVRSVKDKNYSETRLPEVPSAIIETLSHESLTDMTYGQAPRGKFTIARSLYKTILRYLADQSRRSYVVQPLAPTHFRLSLSGDMLDLSWRETLDATEPNAAPTHYIIYTRASDPNSNATPSWTNGQIVSGTTARMRLEPGVQYDFRITACNAGGESFPTEVLSAFIPKRSATSTTSKNILVVSAFDRLSAPAIYYTAVEPDTTALTSDSLRVDSIPAVQWRATNFDFRTDEGVQRGLYPGWNDTAINQTTVKSRYNRTTVGDPDRYFIAGNTFDYAAEHTRALAATGKYNVVSASVDAVSANLVDLTPYAALDIIYGLQRETPSLQRQLEWYMQQGGTLLISGAYLDELLDPTFLLHSLKAQTVQTGASTLNDTGAVYGLGLNFNYYNTLNASHYAARHTSTVSATDGGFCAMLYQNGTSAAVAGPASFTIGFPLECVTDASLRAQLMAGIMQYLIYK